jgi:GntR family transcriptional regulator, rspAB operon transcriptional repressor
MNPLNFELPRIDRQRAADAAYQAIRDSILKRMFVPGERLQIESLAARLGVSLTPVRQAVHQLSVEGLVEIRPRSGTFVAQFNPVQLQETFEIRAALEALAVERAMKSMTAEKLQRLRGLLKDIAKCRDSEEGRQQHDLLNSEMHNLIVEWSGSERLKQLYGELKAHIQIARAHGSLSSAVWKKRVEAERQEHEAIVDAMAAGKTATATEAMRQHIDRGRAALLSSLEQQEKHAG